MRLCGHSLSDTTQQLHHPSHFMREVGIKYDCEHINTWILPFRFGSRLVSQPIGFTVLPH